MEQLISFAWLGLALIMGRMLRGWIPALRRAFIPSSIIGGMLLLLIGPEVLGRLAPGLPPVVTGESVAIWSGLPGFLINIVFAALFLGKVIPGLKEIWRKAGPQVAFSHGTAAGLGQTFTDLGWPQGQRTISKLQPRTTTQPKAR